MPALSRSEILAPRPLPSKQLDGIWGGYVIVRGLRGTERDLWEATNAAQRQEAGGMQGLRNMRARLAVLCVVDDAGARVFADEDADALGATSAAELDRVYDAAAELSGLSAASAKALEKNSEAAPSGASTSA